MCGDSEPMYASTIPSCRRASEEVVDEQDDYDMENVILVAEEELQLRRVLQAWDVGRGVWVWSSARKKRRSRQAAREQRRLYNTLEKGATPGDTHVTLIMTGYLIPVQEPSSWLSMRHGRRVTVDTILPMPLSVDGRVTSLSVFSIRADAIKSS